MDLSSIAANREVLVVDSQCLEEGAIGTQGISF